MFGPKGQQPRAIDEWAKGERRKHGERARPLFIFIGSGGDCKRITLFRRGETFAFLPEHCQHHLLSAVCATMETTSNEYLQRLRECMPILLCTYWTLAAGAAAFALLPVDLAPGVRCCNACVPDHLLLHKQIKQPKCGAETQYSSQQREASYVTTSLERSWAASPTSWSHSNGFYISMLPDQSATPACFIVS